MGHEMILNLYFPPQHNNQTQQPHQQISAAPITLELKAHYSPNTLNSLETVTFLGSRQPMPKGSWNYWHLMEEIMNFVRCILDTL